MFHREPRYTDRQKEALRFLGSGPETLMLFGGAGSGQTYLLTACIALAVSGFPGLRAAVLRRQVKDARESVMEQTFPAVMKQIYGLSRPAASAQNTPAASDGINVAISIICTARTTQNAHASREICLFTLPARRAADGVNGV